jgi:ABC-2 type transport system permease protein
MKKIIWFVIKELIQFRRDKKVVAVVLMAPVIQLILLGYAANMDVKKIDTIVMDLDNSTLS